MNKKLLNIFESKIQNNIISFCKEINASQADLYIIMARKAACLISVLEKLSLVTLRGDVISERVIDSVIEWQSIKRVIIIDDVIISGTTLYNTINTIKHINPLIDIKLYVLGVNEYWFNSDVLNNNGNSYIQEPIRKLNNSECIRLSGDIVRMLAKYPVPYNIDYPIYNTLKLTDKEYKSVLSMPGWQVAEVASFQEKTDGVFTHTFIPLESTLEACGPAYMSDFVGNSLLKIRIYGRSRNDKQHNFHFLTIVPMIIMPPIGIGELDRLFRDITGTKESKIGAILNSPTAKLRFIQFVLADVLARLFLQEINLLLDKDIAVNREYTSLRYLFPSTIIGDVVEVADHFIGNLLMPLLKNSDDDKIELYQIHDVLDVNHILYSPFINMYYRDEIPSRQLVRDKGIEVFKEREYQNIIDRLKRGVSLTYLLKLLSTVSCELRLPFLSAFLDNSIDEGIVVPITVCEKGTVYRAFRHGEDVQFCQQEERLCYDMLHAFSCAVNRDSLQKLWVEKMLVLLFQLGEGNVFEPLQMDVKPYRHIRGIQKVDVASVRYYLQGPVIVKTPIDDVIVKPYLEYTDKTNWLSSKFLQNERSPLTLQPNGMYRFDKIKYDQLVSGDYQIVADTKKIQFAKSIGRVFGALMANGATGLSPSIGTDELVLLTSSLETKNVIGAMAAEINICAKTFKSEETGVKSILDKILSGQIEVNSGFSMIRKKAWFQALNDGQRKFIWYYQNKACEVISNISLGFHDELYKDTWDGFWSPNLEKYGNNEYQALKDLAHTEGLWLLCANSYFLMLEYLIRKNINRDFINPELVGKVHESYEKIRVFGDHKLVKEIIPLILEFKAKYNNFNYIQRNVDRIYERMIVLFNRSDKILEDSQEVFTQNIKLPLIQYYHHALYIEGETEASKRTLNHLYENIKFKMEKSTAVVDTDLRFIPKSDSAMCSQNHCWLISYNEQGAFWLLQFAIEAISILRGQSKFKIFFFPHLPPDCHIKISNNTKLSYQIFWNFVMNFAETIQSTPYSSSALYEITEICNNEVLGNINERFKNYKADFVEEKDIYAPNKRNYKLTKYSKEFEAMERKKIDIGILTIVDEEARAVINGFGVDVKKTLVIDNRYYDEGFFDFDDQHISIVHHQSAKQGNISMAVEFLEMQKLFNPSYMVLLGIAGSIQDKIGLCDVVMCNDILYYDRRKETSTGGVEHRLEHFNMSPSMNNHITRFRMLCEKPFEASSTSIEPTFKFHVSPIGTGEAVIGNALSEVKKWLLTVNSKTGIVETEAAGFTSAFTDGTNSVKDILVIRGISDNADVNKDDNWRQPASENAVIVLKKFIENILYVK